jgi:hypothetical protein
MTSGSGSVTRPGAVAVKVSVFQGDDGEAIVSLAITGFPVGIGLAPATARELADQLVIQAERVEALNRGS